MKLLRLIAVAAVLVTAPAGVAHAQFNAKAGGGPMQVTPGTSQNMGDRASNYDTDRMESELTGAYASVLDRRGRKLNSGQVMNAAKAAATASGLNCSVTEAALRGVTPDNNDLWEVACQSGPGYMITSPGKSTPYDCMVLASNAAQAKADGVELPANSTCGLKTNTNFTPIYAGYATSAGVTCTVDNGAILGVDAYEIGCANADGYVIQRKDNAWTKMPCWRMAASTDGPCKLSTSVESNAAWKDILAGTDAAACNVDKTRQVGVDGQKRVIYEVKCAGSPGYLARVNANAKAEMLHACADPATAGIGGGCKLNTP